MAEIKKSTQGQVALITEGDLGIIVLSARDVTDELWDEYIALQRETVVEQGAPIYVLNWSPYAGPNAKQRQRINQATDLNIEKIKYVALITNSVLVRGAVTALSWLIRTSTLRPFGKVEEGVDFLVSKGCKMPKSQMLALTARVGAEVGLSIDGA